MLPRLSVATRLFLRMLCGEPPTSDDVDVRPSAMLPSGCRICCDLIAL
jgi:hypothetical protein